MTTQASGYKNILCVGAHPDDVELGCGGAIARHIDRGDNVYILIMTRGQHGHHTFENQDECYDSLLSLGLKKENIIYGDFIDARIPWDDVSVSFVENVLRDKEIDTVYTHYYDDRHQDHFNTSKAVSAAARAHINNRISSIFLYEGPSTLGSFDPHFYIELTKDNLDKKIDSLSKYKTQVAKGIVNLDRVKSLATVRGIDKAVGYAEAFSENHVIWRAE